MDGNAQDTEPSSGRHVGTRRPRRVQAAVRGIIVGAVVTLLLLVLAVIVIRRGGPTALTAEELASARQRWQTRGPVNYDLDVTLSGNRPGKVRVSVRQGAATDVTRDGYRPPRRTWDVWTVPGLFDTIQREWDQRHDPLAGFGAPAGARVDQRAAFDPQYGYPVRYQRIVLGTANEIAWEVVLSDPR